MRYLSRWAFALTILAAFSTAHAQEWGNLTGRYVLDGDIPKLKLSVVKDDPKVRDHQCCAAQDVANESLVVNPKNKGIQHIFVYIKSKPKSVHPDLKKSKKAEVVFDQKGCKFIPHSMIVRTDQVVVVKSGDNIPHNTHTIPIFNKGENFIVAANDRVGIKMPKLPISERLPFEVKCDIHGWMSARWLVLNHPYAAITDKDGNFKIDKLPAGDLEFVVWHERVGYVEKKLKVNIKGGATTELDTVKVKVDEFEIKKDDLVAGK